MARVGRHASASSAHERRRACGSKIALATMSSSTPVRAMKSSSPRFTVSGEPTNEQARKESTCLLHRRRQRLDSRHGWRQATGTAGDQADHHLLQRGEEHARLFVGRCDDRHSRQPLRTTSAIAPTAGSVRGRASSAGIELRRARSARRTRNGRPSAAASCAPNRLEPRIHSGTLQPGARHGLHGAGRARRARSSALQLDARPAGNASALPSRSRRSARAVAWSVPGARPRPRSMRPGNSDSSVPNCSAITQRRVVRQHDAAGADADASRCRRPRDRSRTEVAALAMPGMLWCSASQKRS